MRLIRLTAASILFVAGCASTPPPPSLNHDQATSIRKIAVVSIAADQLTYKHVGFTVFQNTETKEDIHMWQLDTTFAGKIANAIGATLSAEVILPNVDMALLSPVYDLNGPYDAPAFRTPNWNKVAAALRDIATQNNVDAIVVLLRTEFKDDIRRTNQNLKGLGIYSRFSTRAAYAYMTLYVIDANTGRPRAGTPVSEGYTFVGIFRHLDLPHIELPEALSDKLVSNMTPAESEQLKSIFLGLIDDGVSRATVRRLFGQDQ